MTTKARRKTRPRPTINPEVLEEFSDDVETLQHAVGELRGLVKDMRRTMTMFSQALIAARQASGEARGR